MVLKKFNSCICLIFFLWCHSACSAIHENKLWLQTDISGDLTKKVGYNLQPKLRFKDNRHKFNHAIIDPSLGYKASKTIGFWLGGAWRITKENDGNFIEEYRIWEQMIWDLKKTAWHFNSRTRLEERKRSHDAQWALRLREKLTLRIPLQCSNLSFVLFDEIFLNLTHPHWVARQLLAQNRLFLGINIPICKKVSLDIGHVSQFEQTNRLNNILYLGLIIKNA